MNKFFTLVFVLFASLFAQAQSLYTTDTIQKVSFDFENSNWEDLLDSLALRSGGYLLGKVTINGQAFDSVGIRYRGSKSFQIGNKKNGYKIKLNHHIKDQHYQGYKVLKLSNALRDPSLVREVLGYEIARHFFEAPKANYLTLDINGESRGLYINVEAIDQDKFLADNFDGYIDGALFEAGERKHAKGTNKRCLEGAYGSLDFETSNECYKQNFHMESDSGWQQLERLVKVLNKDAGSVNEILDVDRALWMLAFNNVLVNLNSYSGKISENFYLYQTNGGKFVPIINDLNLAFGSYKNIGEGSDLKLKKLQTLDPFLHENSLSKPLIRQLLGNPDYKKIYKSHIKAILNTFLVNDAYLKRSKELQRMIQNQVIQDKHWYYAYTDFSNSLDETIGRLSKIPGIEELMSARAEYLRKHPDFTTIAPEIDTVYFKQREKFGEYIETFRFKVKTTNYASKVLLVYRVKGTQDWKSIFMKQQKREGKESFFTTEIKPSSKEEVLEYYLRVENPSDYTFYPSNYLNEVKEVSLEALN